VVVCWKASLTFYWFDSNVDIIHIGWFLVLESQLLIQNIAITSVTQHFKVVVHCESYTHNESKYPRNQQS